MNPVTTHNRLSQIRRHHEAELNSTIEELLDEVIKENPEHTTLEFKEGIPNLQPVDEDNEDPADLWGIDLKTRKIMYTFEHGNEGEFDLKDLSYTHRLDLLSGLAHKHYDTYTD